MATLTKEEQITILKEKFLPEHVRITRIKPKQGYLTVLSKGEPDVTFVDEKAVQQILDGSAKGTRRAVKMKLVDEKGKETVGWVDRKYVDWKAVRQIIKEEV